MANTYLIKGVKGKVGGYISEDNPMPVSATKAFPVDIKTGDLKAMDILDQILYELKIANAYLSILTNEEIE